CYGPGADVQSVPTRRSSDLERRVGEDGVLVAVIDLVISLEAAGERLRRDLRRGRGDRRQGVVALVVAGQLSTREGHRAVADVLDAERGGAAAPVDVILPVPA